MKASLHSFVEAWLKKFGQPRDEREKEFMNIASKWGIREFYDDYVTSKDSLNKYLNKI